MRSHTSCAFQSAPTVGSACVAEAMANTPISDSASAATSVGKSKLSGSGRSATGRLRAGLQHGAPLSLRLLLGEPVLEEHLEHLAHDGGGGGPAVAAVLHHHGEGDLRLLGGSEPHEPGVVALVLGKLVRIDAGRVLEHLRRAGLA